jgi:hypothetical protein
MRIIYTILFTLFISLNIQAEILPEAKLEMKIPLAKEPSTRPMTVAYIPGEKKYYIADGGLSPVGNEPFSKSQVHVYDEKGTHIKSFSPGFDNRSIYYNENSKTLETVTYNVSSAAGFFPNTGIFKLELDDQGLLTNKSDTVSRFSETFGSAGTMPTYDAKNNQYFAKQEKSNIVRVIDGTSNDIKKEIVLDFSAAEVEHHDVTDHYAAFTNIPGHELILLDVDHKRFLIFNLDGKLVGTSKLAKDLKIRAKNHFNGLGYTNNGLFFLYIDSEGEFGTYHAYKVLN